MVRTFAVVDVEQSDVRDLVTTGADMLLVADVRLDPESRLVVRAIRVSPETVSYGLDQDN